MEHSESGWATTEVAGRYLKWLHKWNGGDHKYLLWDLYSSHRCPEIKEYSRKKEVTLEYIPAGLTGQWQPLDCKIFGELKQKAKQRFDAYYGRCLATGEDPQFRMPDAIAMLVDVWHRLSEENVRRAWGGLARFSE